MVRTKASDSKPRTFPDIENFKSRINETFQFLGIENKQDFPLNIFRLQKIWGNLQILSVCP